MSSTAGAVETRTARTVALDRDLATVVWFALVLLACGLSLFLTWRRMVGALIEPPSGSALVVAAIVLGSAAAVLRLLARERQFSVPSTEYSVLSTQVTRLLSLPSPSATSRLLFLLPGVVAILLLAALTLPGTPDWGIAIAWFVLITSEAISWWLHLRPTWLRRQSVVARTLADSDSSAAADEPEIPPGLVQRLTRIREHDRESIHGLLRAEFAAQDRLAVIHMAFCPPLAARPELTAHAIDGDNAETRVTQVEMFGARIEVHRPRMEDQPCSVLIEVIGSVTSPTGA